VVGRVLSTKRFTETTDLASRLEGYALAERGEMAKDISCAASFIRLTLALVEPTLQNIEKALGERGKG
jgi:hypothetical protein